jgi:hypothetical protein
MGVRTFLPLAFHLAMDLASRRSSNSPAEIIIRHVRGVDGGNASQIVDAAIA